MMKDLDWSKEHILWIANNVPEEVGDLDSKVLRKKIEPWLTAVFQSEHLSLLLGTGITTAVVNEANQEAQAMDRLEFSTCGNVIKDSADESAKLMDRGKANFEDDLRTAIELWNGLKISKNDKAKALKNEIDTQLVNLVKSLLENEKKVLESTDYHSAMALLKQFLISFSSRTATRDRLHIFTTNYDRFLEHALDLSAIHVLDRFIGKLSPIMRMNKMELDYHYNPPGIRGEPRYVEGVVRYTKLHGSLDWRLNNNEIRKEPIQFGEVPDKISNPFEAKVIYPNSAKGIDTAYFPYSELFRDFSSATCRPNSVLITYGYGFGDTHINNIILDMMTIPSTHLVIISYDKADGRVEKFVNKCNPSQLTLLIGNHFGKLKTLVKNYLPKSAIDRISKRQAKVMEVRKEIDNSDDTDE
ncbi:MAG: fibronectin-binding protein (FBP) [Balneola sp.]|nr:fibronectin-binding protein (FBP) [Balneola sp.]